MALTVAAVDAIREHLAAIPQKDESAREVTRMEALARMRGEIYGLREGGYSWEEVAEILSLAGCRVTAATVRTELSRGGSALNGTKRGSRGGDRGAQPRPQRREVVGRAESTVAVGAFAIREDSDI